MENTHGRLDSKDAASSRIEAEYNEHERLLAERTEVERGKISIFANVLFLAGMAAAAQFFLTGHLDLQLWGRVVVQFLKSL